MKRVFYTGLLVLVIVLVILWLFDKGRVNSNIETGETAGFKRPLVRVALVADSHNENDLLSKALLQAKGMGINFVIGLGDYTNLGTLGELENAKREFDKSGLEYFLTAGDRDGWDSRNRGTENFNEVFSEPTQIIDREKVLFVILDNSEIYKGISDEDWSVLSDSLDECSNKRTDLRSDLSDASRSDLRQGLCFIFAHKTPFHPQSSHVMGEDSEQVAGQAKQLIKLIEEKKVDGIFTGDLHFFAKFSSKGGSTDSGNSPSGSVRITTVGAASAERNFQGPRFAVLTAWDDYSWDVEDVEIRMDANTQIDK